MMWSASDDEESVFNTCVLSIKYSQLPSFSSIYFFTHETDASIECLLCAGSHGTIMEKTQETLYLGLPFGWTERHSAK